MTDASDARFWKLLPQGRILCELCPRGCRLAEGQRGLCFVRMRRGDRLVLTTRDLSTGFCIDPIEKKPLYHFLPGTATLSFGTVGCNLACKFCQNWRMSRSTREEDLSERADPMRIARAAAETGCRSVSLTYNDPVIYHEFAIDVARACRELGLRVVAVTAGYVNAAPREEFYAWMDAANVDLKAFSESFYRRLTGGHLQPVLETLAYLKRYTRVWLEITTLLIPGENDSEREIAALCDWVVETLGPEVPLHFSAFHPDWKMGETPATSLATLLQACKIAREAGIHHVYTGNVLHAEGGQTRCFRCGRVVIDRQGWRIADWRLDGEGRCQYCGQGVPGVWEARPGQWGGGRKTVRV